MNKSNTWVVYERLIKGQPSGSNSVCDQGEWDEMEQQRPGDNILIKSEIRSEGEAERFARERSDANAPVRPAAKTPRRQFVAPVIPTEPVTEPPVASIATPL